MNELDTTPLDPALEKELIAASEEGDATSQCMLAHCYGRGVYVAQDFAESLKWARLAAEQGDSEGCYIVGIHYLHGLDVTREVEEAVKWLEPAADKQHANAAYDLGVLYANGEGVLRSPLLAYKWLVYSATLAKAKVSSNSNTDTELEIAETVDEAIDWLKEQMTSSQIKKAEEIWIDYAKRIINDTVAAQERLTNLWITNLGSRIVDLVLRRDGTN